MPEDARHRHVWKPDAEPDEPGPDKPRRPVREQLAVIAGVDAYVFRPLANAAADARALAALLEEDFGFELLPARRALIDGDADRATLRKTVEESLSRGREDSRWLFYFAGHGEVIDTKGFLLPADAREGDPSSYLALDWLVEQALASRCNEILIVLDMCYAGRALMKPDVQPWIEAEGSSSRGSFQLLAAGGPGQTVLDGGGRGHSVFSDCLLEALEGWAGIHAEDGSVRFTPLLEYLDREVERRLNALGSDARHQQLLGATLRASLEGNVKGDFRFQSRWPRLPPHLVLGIRHGDPRTRRESLALLPDACRDRPEDLPLPRRLDWNLPLATRLALQNLPPGKLDEATPADETAPSTEAEWRVRRQAARALGELGELGRGRKGDARAAAGRTVEPLLHLAVRDPDAAVRREAAKGLARALDGPGQLETGDRLEKLRQGAPRQLRRRLWQARVALPAHRRSLDVARQGRAGLTRAGLTAGESWRWVMRHPWRRSLAIAVVSSVALLYLVLGTSYFLSTDRFDQVVIRRGLPGFEALPGIGGVAVVTDHHATQLTDRTVATEERLAGSWLLLDDGAFHWGRQLADALDPARGALELWRLGDLDGALDRLRRGIAAGENSCARIAAYLAIQSPAAAEPAMELLLEALAAGDRSLRQEALQALEILRQFRPGAAASTLEALVARLETPSPDDLPAVLDAVSVLAVDRPEAARPALRQALGLLERPVDARAERRASETLGRLLEIHPELSVEHLEDLLDLGQRPSHNRAALLELLAVPARLDPDARRRAVASLLDVLGRDKEPGRVAALGLLGHLLNGQPPGLEESLPALTALADDPDPEIRLAAAALVASLPAEIVPRQPFADGLRRIVRRGPRQELRIRALERLVVLTGGDGATVRLVAATASDPDTGVRAHAVRQLVALALDGKADPAATERVLATALGDQDPGIRQEAAHGILLLADRNAANGVPSLFEKAFSEVSSEIASAERGWTSSQAFGARFADSTPAAAVRTGVRLLAAVRTLDDLQAQNPFRALEALVAAQPTVLPELVPAMVGLLAADGDTDLPWRTAWFLRTLRDECGFDLDPVRQRFLGLLESPSADARAAAAYVLGATAASTNAARQDLAALERTMAGDDARVVARTAFSMQWIAGSHPDLAGEALPLLLRGLVDPRSEVRVAFAKALAEAAASSSPALPAPPPELRAALEDPRPEVRGEVARALTLWGRQRSAELRPAVPWIRDRLAREPVPQIRLRLAAAWGALAGDDPAVAERVLGLAEESLDDTEEPVVRTALWTLGELGEAHPSQAVRIAGLVAGHRPRLEPSLRGLAVLVLRDMGRAHLEGGKAAIVALGTFLVEDDEYHVRWSALVNGLKYVAAAHPSLAPEAAAMLEGFLTRGTFGGDDHLTSSAWEVWIELAAEPAARDPDFLWRRLTSSSRFHRSAALAILARLAAVRPELLPELEAGLERRRHGLGPQVRRAASMASESIEILRRTAADAADPEAEECWQQVLGWLPALGLQPAADQARRRVAAEARRPPVAACEESAEKSRTGHEQKRRDRVFTSNTGRRQPVCAFVEALSRLA